MISSTKDTELHTAHSSDGIAEFRQQVRTFFERDFGRLDELIRQLQQPVEQPGCSATVAAPQQSPAAPASSGTDNARDNAAGRPAQTSKNAARTESRRTGSPSVPQTTLQPTVVLQADRLAELANRITDRIRAAGSNSRHS